MNRVYGIYVNPSDYFTDLKHNCILVNTSTPDVLINLINICLEKLINNSQYTGNVKTISMAVKCLCGKEYEFISVNNIPNENLVCDCGCVIINYTRDTYNYTLEYFIDKNTKCKTTESEFINTLLKLHTFNQKVT